MFLKIGSQLTGMNNNVCKGVYETSFFILFNITIYYYIKNNWEICTIIFLKKWEICTIISRKIKKRVLLLSHIMH